MAAIRPMRKEDKSAQAIARVLENRARDIFVRLCAEIEALPEIAKLKRTPGVTQIEWQQFIQTLAYRALSGEQVERIVHEFNRLYVFSSTTLQSDRRRARR